MRLAHVADTHLGCHSPSVRRIDPKTHKVTRVADFERALEAFVDRVLEDPPDLVLHAGDVFHHARPGWSTVAHFVRQWRRIGDAGVDSFIIGGNHDTPKLRTTGSVFSILSEALPDATIVAGYEAEAHWWKKWKVACVPHGCLGRTHHEEEPPEPLVYPGELEDTIVVFHGDAVQLDPPLLGARYVAMGHIHVRQPVGPTAWYSGSTERTSWGDAPGTPGWLDVTLEDGRPPVVTPRLLPHRPMVDLGRVECADLEEAGIVAEVIRRARAAKEPEAIARVELVDASRRVFRESQRLLTRTLAGEVWDLRLVDRFTLTMGEPGERRVASIGTVEELFDEFLAERRRMGIHDEEFSEKFSTKGREAMDRARERRTQE